MLFGTNGHNRWYDKSIQLIVCPDGTASSVVDHSNIDGTSLDALREYVIPAMYAELNQPSQSTSTPSVSFSELHFDLDAHLKSCIPRIKSNTAGFAAKYTFSSFQLPFGKSFWRSHLTTPATGIQIAIQLACKTYFGRTVPAVDCVSQATFHQGRVLITPTMLPAVSDFCDYMINTSSTNLDKPEARRLFAAATTILNKSINRVAQGISSPRILMALGWLLEEGEPQPALFDDPIYQRQAAEFVTTDSLESDMTECGLAPKNDGAVWIHFQPQDTQALFSVWCREGSVADSWKLCLESAIDRVAEIFSA
jgi:carnitine O-acetyltransferase